MIVTAIQAAGVVAALILIALIGAGVSAPAGSVMALVGAGLACVMFASLIASLVGAYC
jgi:hypothetical protein